MFIHIQRVLQLQRYLNTGGCVRDLVERAHDECSVKIVVGFVRRDRQGMARRDKQSTAMEGGRATGPAVYRIDWRSR